MSPTKKSPRKKAKKKSAKQKPRAAPRSDRTLIRGADVVTVDHSDRVGRFDVMTESGRITGVAPKIKPAGAEVIDAKGLVMIPGFVQAHIHVCQTLFRGQADDMALLTWLRERIWPLEGALEARDARASARLAMTELLLGGTTTILDMGTVRHHDAIFEAAKKLGIRYTGGKCIMDLGQGYPAGLRETTEEALRESIAQCERWHDTAGGRLRYAFSPRFALSTTEEAMRACVKEARARGALLHTHASENPEEVELIRERTGMGNVEYLHSIGFSGDDVVLAHGVWLSSTERRLLRETGTCIAHCPSSNLKLASGIARISELIGEDINVAIGADGAACANGLDQFMEMRLAALLHKVKGGPGAIPAPVALRLATRGGAAALGLKTGAIEVGYAADLVLLDLHTPHAYPPAADLTSRVVYSAKSSDVHSVFVAGQPVVRAGDLLTARQSSVLKDAARAAERVNLRAGL